MGNVCTIINQVSYDAKEIAKKIEPYISLDGVNNVFVKPNLVINPWKGEEERWIATVTNISMIEAVLMVLKEKSKDRHINVVVGDAPMARTNIDIVLKLNGLMDVIKKYDSGSMNVSFIDIREWYWKYVCEMCVSRKHLSGDPKGNTLVNFRNDSAFVGKQSLNFEAFDNINPVSSFHNEQDNIYSISSSILDADLIINLPKMKTHRIAGITCAMKNLVGINSNKNCVPHNTCGDISNGGDESPQGGKAFNESKGIGGIARKIFRKKNPAINYLFVPFKVLYDRLNKKSNGKIGYGMWYGNDTIWRSIIDLNRALLFADKNGCLQEERQRKYLCIVDAIISGEGEGPLHPLVKNTGLILIGDNAVTIDAVACELMGFDYMKIPTVKNAFNQINKYALVDFEHDDILITSGTNSFCISDIRDYYSFNFVPTEGWKNHIEMTN